MDCPECPARAGFTCFVDNGSYAPVHAKRIRLAESTQPSKLSLPSAYTDPEVKAYRTKYWSTACKRGHPEKCNGTRRNHLTRTTAPCENPAHSDFGNLVQQASED